MKNKVVITGASGFVGNHLQTMFQGLGYEVVAVKRSELQNKHLLTSIVDGAKVVINLAGANIIARWSDEYKKTLYHSRLDTTSALIDAFEDTNIKPELFISTSAVGIYDNKNVYSEDDMNYAKDFLGNLCIDWEAEALKANDLGIRTVIFRFGIVLGNDGGALAKMLLPFKLGLGGRIGSGKQGFSFIHIEDLKGAYKFIVEHQECDGIFNLTAPTPTTNQGLTNALGSALHRPTIFPVPEFVLQFLFSEGAKVLTDGQQVVPKRLQECGYEFQFTTIQSAIDNLVK
jgi:uncharacterized protein (TIGR01777 family)